MNEKKNTCTQIFVVVYPPPMGFLKKLSRTIKLKKLPPYSRLKKNRGTFRDA